MIGIMGGINTYWIGLIALLVWLSELSQSKSPPYVDSKLLKSPRPQGTDDRY